MALFPAISGGAEPWNYFPEQGLSYSNFTPFSCDFYPDWVVYTYKYLSGTGNQTIVIEYDVVNEKIWREFQGVRTDITSSWLYTDSNPSGCLYIDNDGKTIKVKQYNSVAHNNQCIMWAMGHF